MPSVQSFCAVVQTAVVCGLSGGSMNLLQGEHHRERGERACNMDLGAAKSVLRILGVTGRLKPKNEVDFHQFR